MTNLAKPIKTPLTLAIFAILAHLLNTKCTEGVLRCNTSTAIPEICDFANSYKFDADLNECKQVKVEGCEVPSFDSSACFLCEKGKILDPEKITCVNIAVTKKVDNCERYDSTGGSCVKCAEDFYISNEACAALGENKIVNCTDYSADAKCTSCGSGFKLVDNTCIAFTSMNGCYLHTDRECLKCSDSYVLTQRSNEFTDFDSAFLMRFISLDLSLGIWSQEANAGTSCKKTNIQNCLEFESFESCSVCETGYFLTSSKSCEINPTDPIPFCSEYVDASTCSTCEGTHFMTGSGCSPVTEVPNCNAYGHSDNKCILCDPGFYNNVAGDTCTLRILPSIPQCATLNPIDDNCLLCDPKYSLTGDNKKCLKNIENCDNQVNGPDLNSESHVCTQCKAEHYLVGNTKCFSSNIPKCQGHLSNENKCETCETGHYPSDSNTECLPQSLDKCLAYISNKNECSQCEPEYYISDTKTCVLKNVAFCETLEDGDTNTCAKCSSLRYLSSDKSTCLSIQFDSNCNSSDGINDTCLECDPGHFMSSNLCSNSNSRLTSQYDSNCAGNTETSLSSGCTRCSSGFSLLLPMSPSTTLQDLQNRFCVSIDSTTGECNQCQETYQLNSSFVCELNSDHATLACAQLMVDIVGGSLSTNTNCAKCSDNSTHYLDSNNVCTPRTHVSANDNCWSIPSDSDSACTSCKEDFLPVIPEIYKSKTIPQCLLTSNLGFTLISNCLVHFSDGTCATCEHGFAWDDNTSQCSTSTNAVSVVGDVIWDEHMNIQGINTLDHDDVTNCSQWTQAGLNKIVCVKCANGYVPAIDEPQEGDTSIMHFSNVRVGGGGSTVNYGTVAMPAVQYCIPEADQFRTGVDTLHVSSGDCRWAVKKSGYFEYACQQCAGNKRGVIVELTHRKNNTALSSSFKAIGVCSDDISGTNMEYENLDYEIRGNTNRVRWSSYIQMTNCSSSKYLVNHFITSIKNPIVTLTDQTYANPSDDTPLQACVSSVIIDSNLVDNCAMYALNEDFSAPIDYSVLVEIPVFRCIACDPGHQSVLDAEDEYIEQCNQISSCSQTPVENTWLGACETPDNDSWDIQEIMVNDENMEFVGYHLPVASADAISNCTVVDVKRQECRMCDYGYLLHNGACSLVSDNISNCSTVSVGEAFLQLSQTELSTFQFNNFAFIRVPPSNPLTMTSNIINCLSCNVDRSLVINSGSPVQVNPLKENGDTNQTACNPPWINAPTRGTPPDNCKNPLFSDSTKCSTCSVGFTLNITDGTCHDHTLHLHCETLETVGNAVVCKECRKSHYLDDARTCQHRRCKYFETPESTTCALCENNYMPTPSMPDRCQLNPDRSSEECDNYSPTLMHCVQCDNTNKIPFLYFLDNTLIMTKCHSFPSSIKTQYGVQEMFMEIRYSSDYSSQVPQLKYLVSEDSSYRVFSQSPAMQAPFDTHCFEFPVVPNCSNSGIGHGGVCFKCDHGFYLSDFNTCTEVIIHDCDDFSARDPLCEKCADSHFLSNNKTICSNRVDSANCLGKTLDSDTCTSCDFSSEYLDPSDQLCKPFTAANCENKSSSHNVCVSCQQGFYSLDVANGVSCNSYSADHCLTFASNKDECVTCKPNFWKQEEGGNVTCNDHSATHCATYKTDSDECQTCDSNHWQNTIDSKIICENYTAMNCSTYKFDNNECEVCRQGFYKNNLKCEPVVPVERCQEYSTVANQCSKCQFGSYLDSAQNKCHLNPYGIRFCAIYKSRDACLVCDSAYYVKNGKCVEVPEPIEGCAEHESETICKTCSADKFLKDNACVSITATNCASYQSETQCASCISNHVLNNTSGNCEDSGISGCITAVFGSPNICSECESGLILSSDSLTCNAPTTSIQNCQEYQSDGVCKRCQSNFILSTDLSQCSELTDKAGANCVQAIFVTQPLCDVCHLGFEKNADSVCVAYNNELCLYQREGDELCSVCKSGSYMDDTGVCVAPVVEDSGDDAHENSFLWFNWELVFLTLFGLTWK